jgi:hypothetical protein
LTGPGESRGASTRRWTFFGLALALLLNVKLSTGFFGIAVALYVLARHRELLRVRGLWLAAGFGLLGAAPILVWNASHDWGMLRLTAQQGANYGLPAPTLPTAWLHTVRYLTPPIAILALLAVAACLHKPHPSARPAGASGAERGKADTPHPCEGGGRGGGGDGPLFLAIAAACTLLPILLSAANSPRNLGFGLLLLWPLAGIGCAPDSAQAGKLRIGEWAVVACLAGSAIYAAGTTAALLDSTAWPHSIGATAIRADAAGWPVLAQEAILPEGISLFAVDYSIAGQISYYTGRPVYSAGGQFRAWGIPESDGWIVLSQGFVPDELVETRLRVNFSAVAGPRRWLFDQAEFTKELRIWSAQGRRAAMGEVVTSLDYLTLAREAARSR